MSNYRTRKDFINRTKSILERMEGTDYEKTAFLNCCMGLLVAPEQWEKNNEPQIQGNVDIENWGIDTSLIQEPCVSARGEKYSVENIAYHFRNCLCHFLFDVYSCNSEKIENLTIVDKNVNEKETFRMTLGFDDFRKFVLRYAEGKLALLKDE